MNALLVQHGPMLWVFGLLAACVACFVANRPRMDVVALIALVGLVLGGTLSVGEALAGFAEPSVILIAAFFVIGGALVHTGVAYRVGDWLVARAGNSETRLLVLLMLAVAGLGSVMSSTGVVAIFIPVAVGIAARLQVPAARLMMPLAFAALISGMLTLVGTPPNMVVSGELVRFGAAGFAFFDFTPLGALILACGIGYMLLARRWLGGGATAAARSRPRRRLRELAQHYRLLDRARRLRVNDDSPMIGRTLGELQLRARYGANVIAIERERQFGQQMLTTAANREILAGDVLLVDFARPDLDIASFVAEMRLQERAFRNDYFTDLSRELGLAEVVVPPESALIGKSILDLRMRSQRGINVMGLRRNGQPVEDVLNEKLRLGDTLLIAGSWKSIRLLHTQAHDFLVLTLPAEIDEAAPAARRAPHALLCLALTVGLMISGVVPNVIAALIGCLLLGALRCIDMDTAYRSIHWQSLILIVGMLPFATALQKTGGIAWIVDGLLGLTGEASPRALLALVFGLTAVVGLFISNTATAVLMAPIAIGLAQQLGLSPQPFGMTVALAASAAFMTPVSSPVNTLVIGPGNYRFGDFVRIGVPFALLVGVLCVALVPLLFPF
ncbi:SLC13 family permease [Azoarcus olearius]|uniref:Transport protein n=1 Tax=Azoarcus sp. (strain BH72) TaxID=418699 RepID=A1K8F1_AZOSB|nr:SLC13 family permease [Azoarcus olearius]ANQ85672.1 putative transport protein [Azoarcus olearius]CAL95106.1 putative transport protein [Azoarcus olearius]